MLYIACPAVGSPWKGSGDDIYCNESGDLSHIYYIYHGKKNASLDIDKHEAISILLKQAFPYFWDKKLMLKSFSLITEITNTVPCSKLYFLPDQSIISFVMNREGYNNSANSLVHLTSWYSIKKKYLDSSPDKAITVKVLSSSIAPTLMQGDEVKIKSVIFHQPEVGSIILFFHHKDHATIHRVVSIVKQKNQIFYRTKGDANEKKDYYLVPDNEVIGVIVQ